MWATGVADLFGLFVVIAAWDTNRRSFPRLVLRSMSLEVSNYIENTCRFKICSLMSTSHGAVYSPG